MTPGMWRGLARDRRCDPGACPRGRRARAPGRPSAPASTCACSAPRGSRARSATPARPTPDSTTPSPASRPAYTWLRDPAFVSIAAVQGHAIGAGFQLALSCDLRVLADDARLCMKEPALGPGARPDRDQAAGRHRRAAARDRAVPHRPGPSTRAKPPSSGSPSSSCRRLSWTARQRPDAPRCCPPTRPPRAPPRRCWRWPRATRLPSRPQPSGPRRPGCCGPGGPRACPVDHVLVAFRCGQDRYAGPNRGKRGGPW